MLALGFLSESTEPDLGWLLWLVLVIFVLIVIIGWIVSNKKGDDLGSAKKTEVVVPEKNEEVVAPSAPDDLKKLEGIGPKVEQILNGAGVKTFAELANADVVILREALASARLQMLEPSGWIEQAVFAAKGDWDALSKLQDELKGGRRV